MRKEKQFNKEEIKESFNRVIATLWEKPKADVFYVQEYAWGWVEELLDKQKEEIREKVESALCQEISEMNQDKKRGFSYSKLLKQLK